MWAEFVEKWRSITDECQYLEENKTEETILYSSLPGIDYSKLEEFV